MTMDVGRMPRGGPDASCLDRMLQTDRREYLDRDDVDPNTKRSVVAALRRTGEWFGNHERFAHLALEEVADVADPKILELGAGHGGLSAKLLESHPTARVTVTDLDSASVAAIAAGPLGTHPRARVTPMDATAIDGDPYDLAVFALSFHHLPPEAAASVLAEGTRAACRDRRRRCTCFAWRRCCRSPRSSPSCTTASSARCAATARRRCVPSPNTRVSTSNYAAGCSVLRWRWSRADRLAPVGATDG